MVNQSKCSCLKSKAVVPPGTVVPSGVYGGISMGRHCKNDSSQTFKGCEEEEEEREEAEMGRLREDRRHQGSASWQLEEFLFLESTTVSEKGGR